MNIADPTICEWSDTYFLLFSDNIWGNFIYYSHLFPSIAALLIAVVVFWQNPKGPVNRSLLFLASTFTIWCLIDLILWSTGRSDLIMFFWSILIHFDLLIYIAAFYFIYTFIYERFPSWWQDLLLFSLYIPLILFGHTKLNLTAFDFTNCWREALEGPLWQYYVYNAELLIAAVIVGVSVNAYRKTKDAIRKKEIALATFGTVALLMSFSFGNITGSLETDWELGQYGLFGMPVFVTFITYLVVRFNSFHAKIIATEALIAGLITLILSLMFVRKLENVLTIAFVTLIITAVTGISLIRSVRREVKQREEIEKLVKDLERANSRLRKLDKLKSEFVSIASHQLRSPLTAIRGYTSMILEGSFGKIPPKATQAIEHIADSSKFMATSVEDYLNVSRIEAGNMRYELMDFNLNKEVENIVDELRPTATRSGLALIFKSEIKSTGIVNADIGKTKQILHNLVQNSIKYTRKGSITVFVTDNKDTKTISVSIIDTGIGFADDAVDKLFTKFERASNAHNVNVNGTGLGLFIARKMARAMKGDIEAHSEGANKGSEFIFTLPLQM